MLVVFTYLITKDIVETLERKIGYELDTELIEQINILEDEFLFDFFKFIPNNIKKTVVDASCISSQLESLVDRTNYPVISLDRVYLINADEYLEVTRLTNPKTGEVKITERPNTKPLQKQINNLRKYGNIVLVDVGAFEGETLLEICRLLEKDGINIKEIYLGVSSNEANEKINKRIKLTVLNLFDFYEWIELRDLFGIDGRNVGMENEAKLFIPYWENLSKWASISKENEPYIRELCKKYNRELVGRLWQEGYDLKKIGKPIKYGGN